MHPGNLIPLSVVPTGRAVVLRQIGEMHDLVSRLASLGFVLGVTINVQQNDRNGPVVVGLKGGRVVLGRDMAARMAVE